MNDGEIGWTAGMLDGEGYVGLNQRTITLAIYNTHFPVMNKLLELWGGHIADKIDRRPQARRGSFVWRAQGGGAVVVLSTVVPYLIKKRRAAELAIRWHNDPHRNNSADLYKELIRRHNVDGWGGEDDGVDEVHGVQQGCLAAAQWLRTRRIVGDREGVGVQQSHVPLDDPRWQGAGDIRVRAPERR
jgi:hypothetical protein